MVTKSLLVSFYPWLANQVLIGLFHPIDHAASVLVTMSAHALSKRLLMRFSIVLNVYVTDFKGEINLLF